MESIKPVDAQREDQQISVWVSFSGHRLITALGVKHPRTRNQGHPAAVLVKNKNLNESRSIYKEKERDSMDCLHPLALSVEELLRFAIDGEPISEEAAKHLEQCPACQQRVSRYTHMHTFLVAQLYRGQCPDSTALSLSCAGLLPEEQRLKIANHLSDCPLCAAEAVDTRQFLAATDNDRPTMQHDVFC